MKIFKKFKYIFIFLLALIVSIPSIALSIWYFNVTYTPTENIDTAFKMDDIAENYSFNDNDYYKETYTLYFYPSTLYLELFESNLNNETNYDLDSNYIEPNLTSEGNVIYDENNNVTYTLHGDSSFYLDQISNNSDYLNPYETSNEDIYTSRYKDSGYSQDEINIGTKDEEVLDSFKEKDELSEQYGFRNLHRYNRFGYWHEFNLGEGRYLPIKLTVNSILSSSLFNETIYDPYSDMIDHHSWVMHFSGWTYVDLNTDKDNPIYPYDNLNIDYDKLGLSRSLLAYNSFDNSLVFNSLSTLSKYADENNVIRLFPTFSNGKGYYSSSMYDYRLGGRDALDLTYYSSDLESDPYVHHKYFTYYSETFTYNSSTIFVAGINDVNIDKESYSSMSLKIVSTTSPGNWPAGWSDFYTFTNTSGDLLFDDLISRYGEGLYNFYLLLGDVESSYSSYTNLSGILDYINSSSDEFSFLQGKNLISIGFDDEKGSFAYSSSANITRPVMLVLEKVTEAKLIDDIPYLESDDNIETYIDEAYLTNDTFILCNENIYEAKKNDNNDFYEITDNFPLNEEHEYIYMMKNINLLDVTSPYFQIRFGNNYINAISFSNNDLTSTIIYNPNYDEVTNSYSFDNENIFINAFNYFDITTIKESNEVAFKIKEGKEGLYDIILVYDVNTRGFKFYTFRKTNNFIKLFLTNCDHYDETSSLPNFVKHTNDDGSEFSLENTNNVNQLLFKRVYEIGDKLNFNDVSDIISNESINYTLRTSFLRGIAIYEGVSEEEVNNLDLSILKKYIIRDHVTDQIIGYIDDNKDLILVDTPVRKNYIFYISLKDAPTNPID